MSDFAASLLFYAAFNAKLEVAGTITELSSGLTRREESFPGSASLAALIEAPPMPVNRGYKGIWLKAFSEPLRTGSKIIVLVKLDWKTLAS